MTGFDRLLAAWRSYMGQGMEYDMALTFAVRHSAEVLGDGPYKIMKHTLPVGVWLEEKQ